MAPAHTTALLLLLPAVAAAARRNRADTMQATCLALERRWRCARGEQREPLKPASKARLAHSPTAERGADAHASLFVHQHLVACVVCVARTDTACLAIRSARLTAPGAFAAHRSVSKGRCCCVCGRAGRQLGAAEPSGARAHQIRTCDPAILCRRRSRWWGWNV